MINKVIYCILKKSVIAEKFIKIKELIYMSAKEKILTLLEVMPEHDAEVLFRYIINSYKLSPKTWDDIEETEPDETDLKMLNEIENNPDCKEFVSSKELEKELNL